MRPFPNIIVLICANVCSPLCLAEANLESTPKGEAQRWLRWVIPLSKEAQIAQQVTVPAGDVKLTLHGAAGPLEQNALRRLRSLFLDKAGVDGSTGREIEIILGVCGRDGRIGTVTVPDAARLRELPNGEQAYLIRPIGNKQLVLAALDARGLFYAALTLRQLLESKFKGEDVTVPLAAITDWPDMSERGLWGCSSTRDIEWLAERKMNLVEFHSKHVVTEDGKAISTIDRSIVRRGRMNGVKTVPILGHLNQLGRRGAYKAYPELRGKGERAGDAPCASHPQIHKILADWMCGYASYEGVGDICCFLSEPHLRCECEECAKFSQFVLESRALVKAWQIARERFPDLRIRVLLTQGSYDTNDQVLAQIPPEVGVTYYHGSKTYDSSPEPMIYPLLQEFAAKGRWLGCYPQLTPSWRIVSPWSSPQFVKFRITEFVEKKLSCLAGYVVPDTRLYDFNVTAAGEWSWNANGRDERELAIAWATRRGFAKPEAIGDWAVQLGQVSWDLYGARFVERYLFRPASIETAVLSGTKPMFGQGFLTHIRDAEHLQQNRQTCRAALRLARRHGSPGIVAETKAISTYYDMVDQLCRIGTFLAEHEAIDAEGRRTLQKELNRLALAGSLNVEALRDWERAVEVGAGSGRFREGVEATEDTVQVVARALAPFGLRNPTGITMSRTVGKWSSDDFRESAKIVREFDVTQHLETPGRYAVSFQYAGGYNGLTSFSAALVAAPKDKPGECTELSVDEHYGHTGHRSTNNVYKLALDKHDPSFRYWIVANIRGTRPQDQQPGRTGCSGEVRLQRRREPDWQVRLMSVEPYAEAKMQGGAKTEFSETGIRVGVIAGGFGSKSMLGLLDQTEGIDALAVVGGRLRADRCQVIILPQFRANMVPPRLTQELEAFVRKGGGVVSLHDAVGYRAMPRLCTSVCEGGRAHVRHETWQVVAEQPITAGLPKGKALSQGYYDHVQLTCGKDGQALAVSGKTGKPMVVAGAFGQGRYVACGLLIGLSQDNEEVPPTPDEAKLLLNAVQWCSKQE